MKYLVATGSSLHGAHPRVGVMIGPRTRGLKPIIEGRLWAADNDGFNGCFTPEAFERHLARLAPYTETCLFVAAPDVIRDAKATLARWPYWAAFVRDAGFPAAYIAQDGAEQLGLPLDADALFLAGSDEWRECHGPALIRTALARGWHVHVGRVNSARRVRGLAALGVHSVDGTHLRFTGVERGLVEIAAWLAGADQVPLDQAI